MDNFTVVAALSELVIDSTSDIVENWMTTNSNNMNNNSISPLNITVSCIGTTGVITILILIRQLLIVSRRQQQQQQQRNSNVHQHTVCSAEDSLSTHCSYLETSV